MESLQSSPKRVGILFGGKSAEHEVSIQSAKNIVEALDKSHYEPILIAIDRGGVWRRVDERIFDRTSLEAAEGAAYPQVALLPGSEGVLMDIGAGDWRIKLDVVFPVLHGPLGEDGTVQGLLELSATPYVGPGVLGSAVGMDKDVMKRLLRDADVPIAPYRTLVSHQDTTDLTAIFDALGPIVFVKPANMGSSVGVSRATTEQELRSAIEEAFRFDTKLLIESAIVGSEIECAILGNETPKASVLGRIVPRDGDFYSYEAKYIDENGAVLEIPADLTAGVAAQAQAIALRAYTTLECEGFSRVDMFVTANGEIIVNEINTIPGFTKISMYPKLWEKSGIAYAKLITQLLELAISRHQKRQALASSYASWHPLTRHCALEG